MFLILIVLDFSVYFVGMSLLFLVTMSVCPSVCLSVCLSVYLSVFLVICLSVCPSVCLSLFLLLSPHLSSYFISPSLPLLLSQYFSPFLSSLPGDTNRPSYSCEEEVCCRETHVLRAHGCALVQTGWNGKNLHSVF